MVRNFVLELAVKTVEQHKVLHNALNVLHCNMLEFKHIGNSFWCRKACTHNPKWEHFNQGCFCYNTQLRCTHLYPFSTKLVQVLVRRQRLHQFFAFRPPKHRLLALKTGSR